MPDMKRSLERRETHRIWANTAKHLIELADSQGGIGDAYLALFMEVLEIDGNEYSQVRELKRELGIEVDETPYSVLVTDVTKVDEPLKNMHNDLVVGLEAARQMLYKHYNALHSMHEQDAEPAEEFVRKLELTGAALVEVGDQTVHFSLVKATSVAKDVQPYEPPSPKKAKPGKKPKPVEDGDIEEDDELPDPEDAWNEDDDEEEDDDDDDDEDEP